ncbi:Dyp-type peroxidase [Streptomyces sp. NPDC058665]|uniref:Dyp-type peroxidase n=1 Tax=Streptomyces sp. NPDC058665 TaxID=3346586 RepID=UPI003645FFFD
MSSVMPKVVIQLDEPRPKVATCSSGRTRTPVRVYRQRVDCDGSSLVRAITTWSGGCAVRRRSLVVSGAAIGLGLVGAGVVAVRGWGGPSEDRERSGAGADPAASRVLGTVQPESRAGFVVLDRGRPGGEVGRAVGALVQDVRGVGGGGIVVGFGLGASLFEGAGAPGLRQLRAMPSFAGDLLDPARSHGDLLVRVTGEDADAVRQGVESIKSKAGTHGWTVRWAIDGFRADNRVVGGRGLALNPFHFSEGFGNPESEREVADRTLVRDGQGEPAWAVGGSYQVVRVIRFATELWDKDSVEEQERIMGRRRDGRWLDGTPVGEQPNFAADPKGRQTPLDSHVRLAAPDRRNPPPLVRRSYSYDRGDGDIGIIFSCFQRDLAEGFEAVQKRLEGEALAKYVLTTGGGYFFVPPPGDAWIDALG